MPHPAHWRDLSKQTKSGLSLPQYRLTIPGANAELILTGITQPPYWTIRCAACCLPETRLNGLPKTKLSVPPHKLFDVDVVQTVALQTLQKHLMDQQAVTAAMLDALDGMGVTQPKNKSKTTV